MSKDSNIQNSEQMPKDGVISCILKVSCYLDNRGFGERIEEIQVKETDKMFTGEGKRISKDKFFKIDTIFFENHTSIRYFTFCLPSDKDKAINLLKDHIKLKVNQYKKEIDVLMSHL